ncbi:hypothetical protein F5887DRAFT_1071581 [Amanita rubescens]|nr:hypothetical protein F5887DRAFT_1071581 [Amanita rubescens]
MGSLGTAAGSKSVPHLDVQMPIVVWVHLVMTCLRGWTPESIAMWLELTGYRLDKVFHCKVTNSRNEHEFVIYEFSDDKKHKLQLRTDRSAGERKDSVTASSSSVESFGTDLGESSPLVDSPQSSTSSLSFVSMKGRISKIPGSIRHAVRRLSDSSISRPSAMSSNQYLAADTITRINCHPPHSNVLRTITFKGDRAKRPSIWDVMILASVVHNDSATYTVLGRQCYWFADTIFGLLEKWATIYNNEATTSDEKEKVRRGRRQGSIGLVPVHRRDPVHINKIWDDFTGERQTMGKQREEFERARTEEILKTKELAGQVTKLKFEQVKERQEREKERRERDEKEQWLRKEQAEREQRMEREREERERQLKKEQEERERRYQEEQRLLRQQIADQQRQLEEQHRQWKLRLQQKEEETERRFQQMEQCIIRMSSSQIDLAPSS